MQQPHNRILSADARRVKTILLLISLASLAFIDYGSLIPLDFDWNGPAKAWQGAWSQAASSAPLSLADRITNVLLSVPLAFFGFGLVAKAHRPLWNAMAAFGMLVFCVANAGLIESLQAFLPDRTPSESDILAQGCGAGLGIALWIFLGGRLSQMLTALHIAMPPPPPPVNKRLRLTVNGLAGGYILALLGANGYLSSRWLALGEAWRKFSDIHFAPFYEHYYASTAWATGSIILYLLLYSPIGVLFWFLTPQRYWASKSHPFIAVGLLSGCVALVVEFGKLFLDGRHPDMTNSLLAAFAGVAAFAIWPRMGYFKLFEYATASAHQPDARPGRHADGLCLTTLLWRIAAGGMLVGTLAGLISYPVGHLWLAAALAAYAFMLVNSPSAWLAILPALLPVFDFAPWTGWFFLNEFDLFVFVTIAIGFWVSAGQGGLVIPKYASSILLAFSLSLAISLLIGLFPLQPIGPNAFSNYYSQYNALVAAKGFLEALGLLPLIAFNFASGVDVLRRFSAGMVAGLGGVVVAALWERGVFPGFFDLSSDFRISALFSAMHTGDSAAEAYLVAALPFTLAWAYYRKSTVSSILAAILFMLGCYALFMTYSRSGYGAFAISMAIMAVGGFFATTGRKANRGAFLGVALLFAVPVSAMLLAAFQGAFIQSRFATVNPDLAVRLRHWQDVMGMMDTGWKANMFGMGLGRYPVTYFYRNAAGVVPSIYQYGTEENNTYLRIRTGDLLYVEQIVAIEPDKDYKVSFDFRNRLSAGGVNLMLCERTFFRSYNCKNTVARTAGPAEKWSHHASVIHSGVLGSGPWFSRRTVKLILENTSQTGVVDIDNVSLIDPADVEIVANGDFSNGHDRWYFSVFNHLPWHIKNIWVQLVFEQGWVGLVAFLMLAGLGIKSMLEAASHGHWIYTVLLASCCGFLSVGFFGSPLDVPRMALLFYLVLGIGYLGMCGKSAAQPAGQAAAPVPAEGLDPGQTNMPPVAGFGKQAMLGQRNMPERILPEGRTAGTSLDSSIKPLLLHLAILMVLMVAGAWIVLHSPAVPYNVAELLNPSHPWFSVAALCVLVFWTFGFPVWIAYWLSVPRQKTRLYPAVVGFHGTVAWMLLSVSVPLESIHDIVGSPVLGWPWHWEIGGRFVALFSVVSLTGVAATFMVLSQVYRRRAMFGFVSWLMTAMVMYPLAYWIIVSEAATDNLTELMAGGGSVASALMLCIFIGLVFGGGAWLATVMQRRGKGVRWIGPLGLAVSLPLAFAMVKYGTEDMLVKYGQVFSALQFLLSTDRSHYIHGQDLIVRYIIFYVAVTGLVAVTQYPLLAWICGHWDKAFNGRR